MTEKPEMERRIELFRQHAQPGFHYTDAICELARRDALLYQLVWRYAETTNLTERSWLTLVMGMRIAEERQMHSLGKPPGRVLEDTVRELAFQIDRRQLQMPENERMQIHYRLEDGTVIEASLLRRREAKLRGLECGPVIVDELDADTKPGPGKDGHG